MVIDCIRGRTVVILLVVINHFKLDTIASYNKPTIVDNYNKILLTQNQYY